MTKFLQGFAYWWHRATTGRYVLYLEAEVERLKRENLALWQGQRGVMGMGQVRIPPETLGSETPAERQAPRKAVLRDWPTMKRKLENQAAVTAKEKHRQRLQVMLDALRTKRTGANGKGADHAAE